MSDEESELDDSQRGGPTDGATGGAVGGGAGGVTTRSGAGGRTAGGATGLAAIGGPAADAATNRGAAGGAIPRNAAIVPFDNMLDGVVFGGNPNNPPPPPQDFVSEPERQLQASIEELDRMNAERIIAIAERQSGDVVRTLDDHIQREVRRQSRLREEVREQDSAMRRFADTHMPRMIETMLESGRLDRFFRDSGIRVTSGGGLPPPDDDPQEGPPRPPPPESPLRADPSRTYQATGPDATGFIPIRNLRFPKPEPGLPPRTGAPTPGPTGRGPPTPGPAAPGFPPLGPVDPDFPMPGPVAPGYPLPGPTVNPAWTPFGAPAAPRQSLEISSTRQDAILYADMAAKYKEEQDHADPNKPQHAYFRDGYLPDGTEKISFYTTDPHSKWIANVTEVLANLASPDPEVRDAATRHAAATLTHASAMDAIKAHESRMKTLQNLGPTIGVGGGAGSGNRKRIPCPDMGQNECGHKITKMFTGMWGEKTKFIGTDPERNLALPFREMFTVCAEYIHTYGLNRSGAYSLLRSVTGGHYMTTLTENYTHGVQFSVTFYYLQTCSQRFVEPSLLSHTLLRIMSERPVDIGTTLGQITGLVRKICDDLPMEQRSRSTREQIRDNAKKLVRDWWPWLLTEVVNTEASQQAAYSARCAELQSQGVAPNLMDKFVEIPYHPYLTLNEVIIEKTRAIEAIHKSGQVKLADQSSMAAAQAALLRDPRQIPPSGGHPGNDRRNRDRKVPVFALEAGGAQSDANIPNVNYVYLDRQTNTIIDTAANARAYAQQQPQLALMPPQQFTPVILNNGGPQGQTNANTRGYMCSGCGRKGHSIEGCRLYSSIGSGREKCPNCLGCHLSQCLDPPNPKHAHVGPSPPGGNRNNDGRQRQGRGGGSQQGQQRMMLPAGAIPQQMYAAPPMYIMPQQQQPVYQLDTHLTQQQVDAAQKHLNVRANDGGNGGTNSAGPRSNNSRNNDRRQYRDISGGGGYQGNNDSNNRNRQAPAAHVNEVQGTNDRRGNERQGDNRGTGFRNQQEMAQQNQRNQ